MNLIEAAVTVFPSVHVRRAEEAGKTSTTGTKLAESVGRNVLKVHTDEPTHVLTLREGGHVVIGRERAVHLSESGSAKVVPLPKEYIEECSCGGACGGGGRTSTGVAVLGMSQQHSRPQAGLPEATIDEVKDYIAKAVMPRLGNQSLDAVTRFDEAVTSGSIAAVRREARNLVSIAGIKGEDEALTLAETLLPAVGERYGFDKHRFARAVVAAVLPEAVNESVVHTPEFATEWNALSSEFLSVAGRERAEAVADRVDAAIADGDYAGALDLMDEAVKDLREEQLVEYKRMTMGTRMRMLKSRRTQTSSERAINRARRMAYRANRSQVRRARRVYRKRFGRQITRTRKMFEATHSDVLAALEEHANGKDLNERQLDEFFLNFMRKRKKKIGIARRPTVKFHPHNPGSKSDRVLARYDRMREAVEDGANVIELTVSNAKDEGPIEALRAVFEAAGELGIDAVWTDAPDLPEEGPVLTLPIGEGSILLRAFDDESVNEATVTTLLGEARKARLDEFGGVDALPTGKQVAVGRKGGHLSRGRMKRKGAGRQQSPRYVNTTGPGAGSKGGKKTSTTTVGSSTNEGDLDEAGVQKTLYTLMLNAIDAAVADLGDNKVASAVSRLKKTRDGIVKLRDENESVDESDDVPSELVELANQFAEESGEVHYVIEDGSGQQAIVSAPEWAAYEEDGSWTKVHEANGDDTSDEEDDTADDGDGEPAEDDITTEDHHKWYQNGKLYVTGDVKALKRQMKKDQFYPDVWFISDHGNAHLIDLSETVDEAAKTMDCPDCGATMKVGGICPECGYDDSEDDTADEAVLGRYVEFKCPRGFLDYKDDYKKKLSDLDGKVVYSGDGDHYVIEFSGVISARRFASWAKTVDAFEDVKVTNGKGIKGESVDETVVTFPTSRSAEFVAIDEVAKLDPDKTVTESLGDRYAVTIPTDVAEKIMSKFAGRDIQYRDAVPA